MEDGEGGRSFDFEDAAPTQPTTTVHVIHQSTDNGPSASAANHNYSAANANFTGRRSYRQTVCRHWLRSLCMKGEACGFLHQYDKSRMPICRFFQLYGECRQSHEQKSSGHVECGRRRGIQKNFRPCGVLVTCDLQPCGMLVQKRNSEINKIKLTF
ncbi:hypothetical protein L1987_37821 [Smallanthus sonchifolius]|uniref:Uncharacterized protein n=1 Tax=Smallanthus sonchifolius TaxID=185202 RepID=A0ACB9HHD9_9ASTR|nr:hypothetical protein L1987_37821 [Smallanthus sonchifolius]